MALTDDDIRRIASLLAPIREELSGLKDQMNAQFTEVQNNFESLFARDERREQENLALNEQIKRHDERIETLEQKVA